MPCQPGVCDYSLDVTGGWYDAGDHGKYVVNGGIAVHQLHERRTSGRRSRAPRRPTWATARCAIPESGNARAGHPRRGPLGAGVPAEDAGAGRQAARRHGPPQDPRRGLDRPAAAARTTTRSRATCTRRRPRPRSTWPRPPRRAPGCSRRTTRRSRPARLAAARTAWRGRARPTRPIYAAARRRRRRPVRRQRRHRRVLLGGRRAVPHHRRRRSTATACSPRRTTPPTSSDRPRLRLGAHARRSAGSTWPRCRTGCRAGPRCARRWSPARTGTWPRSGANPYGAAVRARPDNLFDWGSNNLVLNNMVVLATAYDITGDATRTATACSRAWTTSSAATRSTSPT